jgi:hypothetical protein
MILRTISGILLIAILVPDAPCQQRPFFKPAYKLKDIDAFGCCGLDLEISLLAEGLRREPGGRAHIIGYSGPTDPSGKVSRYLAYLAINFSDYVASDPSIISVVDGGYRDVFTIELWIVPRFATVPEPAPSVFRPVIDYRFPVLFDKHGVDDMGGTRRQPGDLTFASACTLSFPQWPEYFRILRDQPWLQNHMIIYIGDRDRNSYAKTIRKFVLAELKNLFPEDEITIDFVYGGRREYAQVELWLMPKGGPAPKASPKTSRDVNRSSE